MNNFASVYGILTKLCTRIHHYTTFLCTKFQRNRITHFHFMVTFTPLRKGKEEKKVMKLSQLRKFISQKRLAWFSWILECGVLMVEGISTTKHVWFCANSIKLCMQVCILVWYIDSFLGCYLVFHSFFTTVILRAAYLFTAGLFLITFNFIL